MVFAAFVIIMEGPKELSREEIERRAEMLGMGYREQFLIFPEENRHPQAVPANQESAPGLEQEAVLREVVINQGKTLTEAAKILYESGVIKDPAAFIQKVQQMGLSQHLRAGSYRLSPGIELEELIRQITR
jgi:hypothetical protein